MNENLDFKAIRQLLNRSLSQLDQTTLAELHAARRHALQHASFYAPSVVLTWVDTHVLRHIPARRHAAATWFAAALLVIGLLGGISYYWQQANDNSVDVDIAILTDDLPINYYVD
jgi:Protein of unknown function (DUF3619)